MFYQIIHSILIIETNSNKDQTTKQSFVIGYNKITYLHNNNQLIMIWD